MNRRPPTIALGLFFSVLSACGHGDRITVTVAQIERVRAGVSVTEPGRSAAPVEAVQRLVAGAVTATDEVGRALLALDHGERLLLDRQTRLRVTSAEGVDLEAGRVWVNASGTSDPALGETVSLRAGSAVLHLRGVRASIERQGDGASLDVLDGEVAWETGSRHGVVHAGEHALVRGAESRANARSLFDDWTGGLADDQPTGVSIGAAVGLGSVAARKPDEQGAPRWPLVVQRVDARVTIQGDLAVTELEQTFFNPAADTVEGIYSLNIPRGAVLQRFAVDRHGDMVDGFVRERNIAAREYQAQVYAGSTHDPALLEWDAPGRYHARLFPITPGLTRRVLVTYTQWLTPRADGGRSWRLPLASLGARVGELKIDVDVAGSRATEIRASEGARRDDSHVTLVRSDVIPTSDFVLDLRGAPPADGVLVRAPGPQRPREGAERQGFIRVSVQAPEASARLTRDEGIDLAVVVDHSAATDAAALLLGQSFAEALARSLSERDRIVVIAGDVGTRAVGAEGPPRLAAVTAARRQQLLDALSRDRRGGATDVGAMIEAAQGALDPLRNGAIVYIGDGVATVGESDLAGLRARLTRMSPHPRLYAVAVGEAPRLDLLAGITEPSGFAARVSRRADVARVALDLIEHASRPLVRDFRVDLGPGVERVYPVGPVDLPAGEPLVVIGRYLKEVPTRATVRASWNGRESTREISLTTQSVPDRGDLRFRWASMRLDHLLARGESRAVIVELGTRFGLITPFTSLYVPSEDEPMPARNVDRVSDARDLSFFDLLPLVGCSRSASDSAPPPSAVAAATPSDQTAESAPQTQVQAARQSIRNTAQAEEGRMGNRRAQAQPSSGRFAVQGGEIAPGAATTVTREMNQPIAAANADEASAAAPTEAPSPSPPPPSAPSVAAPVTPEAMGWASRGVAQRHASGGALRSAPSLARPSPRGRDRARAALTPTLESAPDPAPGSAPEPEESERANLDGLLGAGGGYGGSVRDIPNQPRTGDLDGNDRGEVSRLADNRGYRRGGGEAAQAAARVLSRCSDAASVALDERLPLWRERLSQTNGPAQAARVYGNARRSCELPGWPDRVSLLRLIVAHVNGIDGQIALYREFRDDHGARNWVRDVLLRTLARSGELGRASSIGLARLDAETLTGALARAASPQERLNVLRLLARRYPDDLELALLLLDAAAVTNDAPEVRRVCSRLRDDPRTDARVRTALGEALLGIHDDAEARRAFSEIVEFAPDDPWARKRLGDIALAHGWADEAYRQYQTLAAQLNEAPEILLRLAWAARAAGRLDEALRLAERVTTQSPAGAIGTVAEAAGAWIATELSLASAASDVPRDTLNALRQRWRRSPAARSAGAVRVVLRWLHPDDEGELWVAGSGDSLRRADLVASLVPLETSVWAEAPEALQLEVRRGGGARPRGDAELVVLWNEGTDRERVARQTVHFDPEHPRFGFDARDGQITARALVADVRTPPVGGAR